MFKGFTPESVAAREANIKTAARINAEKYGDITLSNNGINGEQNSAKDTVAESPTLNQVPQRTFMHLKNVIALHNKKEVETSADDAELDFEGMFEENSDEELSLSEPGGATQVVERIENIILEQTAAAYSNDLEKFKESDAYKLLNVIQNEANIIENKLTNSEELTDADVEALQNMVDRLPFVLDQPQSALPESESAQESESTETLYGMQLPAAGPVGRFGATSFREGVLFAMERDEDVAQLPEKKQLIDQALQIVGYVPDSGLTEEQVAQLTELSSKINSLGATTSVREQIDSAQKPILEDLPSEVGNTRESVEDKGSVVKNNKRRDFFLTNDPEVKIPIQDRRAKPSPETGHVEALGSHGQHSLEPQIHHEAYLPDSEVDVIGEEAADESELEKPILEEAVSIVEKERALEKFEKEELDFLDRMLGTYKSPYFALGDIPFSELRAKSVLAAGSKEQNQFKVFLAENDVKYEVFTFWIQQFDEIESSVGDVGNMTFAEVIDVYFNWA